MTNNNVLERFIGGYEAKNAGKNLISDGKCLVNYNTEIARLFGRYVLVNNEKYSSTTSKHQNWLQRNEKCLVVNASVYNHLINSDNPYEEIINVMERFEEFEDVNGNVNTTLTTKRGKETRDRVFNYLYKNVK